MTADDDRWMRYALRLGERALATTAENPAVGCVVVKQGRVLGVGCTAAGGRPHAETQALAMAGAAARGATAYVSLEPCSHYGKTPPCAEALIAAGIARCVVAIEDPNPKVSGRGIVMLKAAGIAVDVGTCAEAARLSHRGFFTRIVKNRPYVILKMALSADEKIAAGAGQQTTITGEQVRARVHLLRAKCDAILVGMNTVRVDDPALDVRLPGLAQRSPKPYVLGHGPLPAHSKLAARAAEVISTLDLAPMAKAGINMLLVEGGAATAKAFLDAILVDEIQLFQSAMRIGAIGVDAWAGSDMREVLSHFRLTHEERLGDDRLNVYVRR